ncbi:MAG: hypothetical protein ACLQOQ_15195 [Beijerinckiaceae bacterium]
MTQVVDVDEVEKLLLSGPGRPDDPAWSAVWHAYDDLARRAAYYGLMGDHEQRQACIDAAKRLAGDAQPAMPIEGQVSLWEEITSDVSNP